jgi:Tfp pilus assembly protein PilF
MASFEPTADLLLLGVQITRQQGDRMAEEKFARKLRMDFPSSDQTRALADRHKSG